MRAAFSRSSRSAWRLAPRQCHLYNYSLRQRWHGCCRHSARDDQGYALFSIGSSILALALMLPATAMAGMTLPLITFLLLRGRLGERSDRLRPSAEYAGVDRRRRARIHIGLPLLGLKEHRAAAAIDVVLGILLIWGRAAAPAAMGILPSFALSGVAAVIVSARSAVRDRSDADRIRSVARTGGASWFPRTPGFCRIGTARRRQSTSSERENGRIVISTTSEPDRIRFGWSFGVKPPALDECTMVLAAARFRSRIAQASRRQ